MKLAFLDSSEVEKVMSMKEFEFLEPENESVDEVEVRALFFSQKQQ
tara:strand:- start:7764 stop:7901 length:138 start_codon:yes stop_codon:yes gene_type:complete